MKPTTARCHPKSSPSNGWIIFPALAIALLMTGCIRHDSQGEQTTYLYETWTCWVEAGAGVLIVLIGLSFEKKFLVKMVLVPGGLILLILSPNALVQYVKVDPDQFEVVAGSWWSPGKQTLRYQGLIEIKRITEKREGFFDSLTPARVYYCVVKGGGGEKIPRGQLVDEAEDDILQKAIAKGVLVSGEWSDAD